CLQDIQLPWTF
nr:immunoglobulin light chain junction region [Macaca mulatta]MOW08445.1 immunoglobulin light chain junction region [Macaca mulatta]MOW51508.1 immunoglobulin light chain junction region [Macaca mulatta]MOW51629.1 immunoglobulin light chain junction region [Macaca mulatta]MOW51675.1 immunoglobulin light chain junction region [Macaca mulatta]